MQAQRTLNPTAPDSVKRVPPWILRTLRVSLLFSGAMLSSIAMSDSFNAIKRMEIIIEAQSGIIEELQHHIPNQDRINVLQNWIDVSTIPFFVTADFFDGAILVLLGLAISTAGSKVKPRVRTAAESVSSGNAFHQSH